MPTPCVCNHKHILYNRDKSAFKHHHATHTHFMSFASTSALSSTSNLHTSSRPYNAAQCRGVYMLIGRPKFSDCRYYCNM